jgi:hypothetical protein
MPKHEVSGQGPHPEQAPDSVLPSATRAGPWAERFLYGSAIFLSAFLSFQIQPLIAKLILPWFGGAASVWTTCLLFFQVFLLLGYLYAHGLIRRVHASHQARVHLLLLAASLLALPIIPNADLRRVSADEPTVRVLQLLTLTVGAPYLLLASTSPLLQAWYAGERGEARAYRLYALSNAGALLAVLSYPVLVEPFVAARRQAQVWSAAYGLFSVLCAATMLCRRSTPASETAAGEGPRPPGSDRALWLALPCCGSTLLLSVTNHLSQNIAAVPLLWVVPLSLYLLSFVLCFAGRAWYNRNLFLRLLAVALGGMAYALQPELASVSLILLVALFCAGLFVCCMVCHGELARLQPRAQYLTSYYLTIALGGAVGGLFVALIAPRIFSGYFELPLALGACAFLALIVLRRDPQSRFYQARWQPAWLGVVALALAVSVSLIAGVYKQVQKSTVMVRNFYGTLREVITVPEPTFLAQDSRSPWPEFKASRRQLLNGPIQHGVQFLDFQRRRLPTAYYGPRSGVGLAIAVAGARGALRVGVIGLGVGTVATYGRPGDYYVFYEINPQVIELAKRDFHFLADSAARIAIVPGDARLALEAQAPQGFDVLAVDAFSGDAIPVHLLTREAFELYSRHLKADGILAVHISNNYLNLQPVVRRAATWLGKPALRVVNGGDDANAIFRSTWILIVGNREFAEAPELRAAATTLPRDTRLRLWTDDYSNLFGILKWVLGS